MKEQKGITIVSLIITIAVLLILVGVSINQINGEGLIGKADETELMVDYKMVDTDLRMYKLQQQDLHGGDITDKSLIGTVYKKIYVNETYRELAAIVDFDEINSKPTYGKGGKLLLKEGNINEIKTIEVLSELVDVYVIDLWDSTMYYVNGEQIYAANAEKIDVEGSTEKQYAIQTVNDTAYRYITKWNVTLGEEAESATYSTVVLPININYECNATIYWGDGQKTKVEHNPQGVKLTTEELTAALTHNYNLEDMDNGIVTIEISGNYPMAAAMLNSTTKQKLIQIQQWGNVQLSSVNFNGCVNLAGMVPANTLIQIKSTDSIFSNTAIIGLEEGFKFSGGNYLSMFANCTKLENIPNSFVLPEGGYQTKLDYMFDGCTSLKSLPETFVIPNDITLVKGMFRNCSELTTLPNSFTIPEGVTDMSAMFNGCSKLENLPDTFTIPYGVTKLGYTFSSTGLKTLPETVTIPNTVRDMSYTFLNSKIEKLPDSFIIPEGVTNIAQIFAGCTELSEISEKFSIPKSVTNMSMAFRFCNKLSGTLTIRGNPTSYTYCFQNAAINSGSILKVNYTADCTNIANLVSKSNTNSTGYVIQGDLVE